MTKVTKINQLQQFCYDRNMICYNCYYSQYNKTRKCFVKKSIIEMILRHGVPENMNTKGIIS